MLRPTIQLTNKLTAKQLEGILRPRISRLSAQEATPPPPEPAPEPYRAPRLIRKGWMAYYE